MKNKSFDDFIGHDALCSNCNSIFDMFRYNVKEYAYKLVINRRIFYFCSYKCMRDFQKKLEINQNFYKENNVNNMNNMNDTNNVNNDDKNSKSLSDLGFVPFPSIMPDEVAFSRYIADCSQILTFNSRTKEWAISSKSLDNPQIGKFEILGLTVNETKIILDFARKLFNE